MSVKRAATEALFRISSQFPVIAIIGPRQSGKTTLAKNAFPQKKYITFDEKDVRELAQANPKDFLLAFPKGAIIDEAQKVPEIFDAVKLIVDSGPHTPGKFILTGSSQFKLKENMSDSLAGRLAFIKLLPFSLTELTKEKFTFENPYKIIFQGLYPPFFDSTKHYIREDWFENYIDTYLDFDVREHINATNVSVFKKFIQICALYSGKMLSMGSISKHLNISIPTVKQWLSVLESSYIIHFLEPDFNNLGKTLVKTPKLYFTDTGLLCYLLRINSAEDLILSPYRGSIIETFAISEILKSRFNKAKKGYITFYRDLKGFEVDVIADWEHSLAIEIKSTSDAEQKLSHNVRKYNALRSNSCKPIVFYLGNVTCTINGVMYVSWKDWGNLENLL